MINKVEARGFVCVKKGHKSNWVIFVGWMVHDQLRRLQCLEVVKVTRCGKLLRQKNMKVEASSKKQNSTLYT
jgi:hypothetical protein